MLVLAGDLADPFSDIYHQLLVEARHRYDHVIVISGNHEYYNDSVGGRATYEDNPDDIGRTDGSRRVNKSSSRQRIYTIAEIDTQISRVCAATGCKFLNRSTVTIGKWKFVGTTMWNMIPTQLRDAAIAHKYNPFRYIHKGPEPLSLEEYHELHAVDIDWLRSTLSRRDEGTKTVVITHYPPSHLFSQQAQLSSRLKGLYTSDVTDLINPSVTAWLCGHSHASKKFSLYGTTLASNTFGAPGQSMAEADYNPEFAILLA